MIRLFTHKLGRGHRDKVQQFMAITGASEKVALQALKASDWHLEGAFDLFYSQPQVRSVTDSRHLEEFYQRYRDPYVDMIMADGISLLCNDLQVDPGDIVMLVVSWHMKAATMCEFSRPEFIGGLQALGVDSIEKFRERIPFMRSELKDEQKFREIYNFAFNWAKEKMSNLEHSHFKIWCTHTHMHTNKQTNKPTNQPCIVFSDTATIIFQCTNLPHHLKGLDYLFHPSNLSLTPIL
ncbi:DCN1-like protein 2 isoform X3 [Amborella trichopoda]|uniref:DCN1-like protein 2 isoform X3 n=1 Tax=Amborella trichopoda TaxID=13333 RepID=UPI0009C0ED09|nr:DCN1-like protein 2 isoform X3 [Amborella trichopoda]|eukprot:XP_020526409.1 DCN1-like protein 2 isoform X3 [Amborella trichopoda]